MQVEYIYDFRYGDAMRLTRHTDYALRVLIHLAVTDGQKAAIGEIAEAYDLSRNHLMKIVNELARAGFIATMRGRGGGFTLARSATDISLGEVVRLCEPDLRPADCGTCALQPACGLSGILMEAIAAFLKVLDGYTLADAARDRSALSALIAALPTRTCPA